MQDQKNVRKGGICSEAKRAPTFLASPISPSAGSELSALTHPLAISSSPPKSCLSTEISPYILRHSSHLTPVDVTTSHLTFYVGLDFPRAHPAKSMVYAPHLTQQIIVGILTSNTTTPP